MEKFTFSSEGIREYTAEIYGLSDDRLYTEALSLAEDFPAHMALRFELQVHQVEYLRSIKRSFADLLGWKLAAAVLCRRPINFIIIDEEISAADCILKCIMASSKISSHYSEGVITTSGELTIQFCEK